MFQVPALSALKQNTFAHGQHHKKSQRQLDKEREEQKKVEEEKAAAIAFKEFTEAFEGDGPLGGTTGYSGGSRHGRPGAAAGSGNAIRGGFVKASGMCYRCNRMPVARPGIPKAEPVIH